MRTNTEFKLEIPSLQQMSEQAIPLILFDTSIKKFVINDQAETFIKKLETPLGVIVVAGMYRTGKSYLLNRMLLNRSSGFSVGPSINPCTKGLWIWPTHIHGTTPDGSPINVLIIDTEGIGATDEDQNHDNRIITLGLLLSSFFIYNSLGSIDENAIQNLSFIVNITKNIQLNNSKRDEVDPGEIAKFLPSFMWVIRDFTLRLISTDNEPITSKEYLERSLELQKGYSDSIENKNKIRILIKEFFRDRDCVTLVRPLTEEQNLQNLERLDTSKLRAEFLEQISQLRKRVLLRVKPKAMNGKIINGEMFCNLMKSYVEAINNGAIPVIENAYAYMCKNECNRAMTNSLKKYTDSMNEHIKQRFPMEEVELTNQHKESKKTAIEFFNKTAFGVYQDDFMKQLKEQIKEKHLGFIIDNEKESKVACENFLNKNYTEINQNLVKMKYKSFNEFSSDIESFINFYLEKAPAGPKRTKILYEFIIKELLMQSENFINKLVNEMETSIGKNNEQIIKMNVAINEMKAEFAKELNKRDEMLKKYETEKSELMKDGQSTRDNLKMLIKEKENLIRELNEKLDTTKKECEIKVIEMNSRMELNDEMSREKERQMMIKEGDFEKSKSLYEQKIKFLEKTIEDLNIKERENLNKMKIIQRECLSTSRDSVEKFESQIKALNEKFEIVQERNIDLETKVLEKEKRLENEKLKSDEIIRELRKKVEDLNSLMQLNETEIKSLESQSTTQMEIMKSEYEMKISELKSLKDDLETKLKDTEEQFISYKNRTVRETSMLKQQLEFNEVTIRELKTQLQDDKKNHEAILKILEDKNNLLISSQEECLDQISQIKMNHLNELNKLNDLKEEHETKLKNEIFELTTQLQNLNEKYEKEVLFIQSENQILITKIEEYENQIKELKSKLNSLILEKEKTIEEHKVNVEKINSDSSLKIEYILRQCREEIEDNNRTNERQLNDIRRYYEIERQNLDIKLQEETEKMNKHINETDNYYLEKLKDLEKTKDEKIFDLEEAIENLESDHNNYVAQVEQEIALKNGQIESLNKFLNDYKDNITTIQNSHEASLISYYERFKEEKKELNDQMQNFIQEIKEKERENGILLAKNEHLDQNAKSLLTKISQLNEEFAKEQKETNNKVMELQSRLNLQNDQLAMEKSDFNKQLALKIQEIEFYSNKISELQKSLEENEIKNEEKFKMFKENLEQDYLERFNKMLKEKEEFEMKLVEKKKELKEIEINFNKEKNMLEREKTVLNEKLIAMNKQKEEIIENFERERDNLKNNLNQIKHDMKMENDVLTKENDFLKNRLKKIENEYQDLSAKCQKDEELFKAKCEFLDEQKNQARRELYECQKKFEMQLESFSKKGTMEKDKFEIFQNQIISSMEKKYKGQIKEIQDSLNLRIEELVQIRRQLEIENKNLSQKLQDVLKLNSNDINELQKKILISTENENKLKKEISELQEEKEKIAKENLDILNMERELNKSKIIELENKLREYESKRNNLAVDIVKSKAVNDKDKENLQKEVEKLNEKLQIVERMNMKLINENKEVIKENEKLKKGSAPMSRMSSNSSSSNIFYIPRINRYNSGNKENIRTHSNTSFENVDKLDLLQINKPKYSTQTSQNGDDEMIDDSI
jgi:hypothetical protein